jgi:hypothetical protein
LCRNILIRNNGAAIRELAEFIAATHSLHLPALLRHQAWRLFPYRKQRASHGDTKLLRLSQKFVLPLCPFFGISLRSINHRALQPPTNFGNKPYDAKADKGQREITPRIARSESSNLTERQSPGEKAEISDR